MNWRDTGQEENAREQGRAHARRARAPRIRGQGRAVLGCTWWVAEPEEGCECLGPHPFTEPLWVQWARGGEDTGTLIPQVTQC